MLSFSCRGENGKILFSARQISQSDAGDPARNLTQQKIKFSVCSPARKSSTCSNPFFSAKWLLLRRKPTGRQEDEKWGQLTISHLSGWRRKSDFKESYFFVKT